MKKLNFVLLAILALLIFRGDENIESRPKFVIAVLDFKNSTGKRSFEYLKEALPEIFATNLAQTPDITVLERDRVKKILKEKGLIMAGVTEGDEKKIGKLLSARQLLSGTVVKTGRKLRIDVRLTDVSTGRIIVADKKRCGDVDDIIDAVDILSEKMVKQMTGRKVVFTKDIESETPALLKGKLVDLEVLAENSYYPSNSREPFYIRAGFHAKKVELKKKRLPLNISVVLDRSGSMSDSGKLDYAKKAIKFIIRNLTSRDIISVVVYDDAVDLLIPPQKIEGKDRLIKIVDKITTGGSTNLSGGMLEGYNQVKKNIKSGQVNRVLLISDGLANVGITDPVRIQHMVRTRSRGGITISTFGVGQYFNEKLLTGISEYGNANYYYISEADKVPEIFSREMEGLLAVVAQNCKIQIESRRGAQILSVHGYKFEKEGNIVTIKMGDIISEEKKLVLIKIIPPRRESGRLTISNIVFSYDDAVADRGRVNKNSIVSISYTDDRALINKNLNAVVAKDKEMFMSSAVMEETMDMVDRGDIDKAREKIVENLSRVRSGLRKYKSKEMKRQVMNIIEYKINLDRVAEKKEAAGSDSFQRMQKESRSSQYKLRKRK